MNEVDLDAEVEAAASSWTQSREPPDTLLAPMLPYQKEGLAWMCAQEAGPLRGGILADEMGMGKTLQAISVMLAHPSSEWKKAPPLSAKARGKAAALAADALPEDIAEAALREGLVRGGTLVIVPVIALIQWGAEILKWSAPGTLSIYTYHGPKREPLSDVLAKYDVVLTTYSTLEYDFRQAQADEQVYCRYCRKKFKNDLKLAFHNRWFCGPNASRSAAQSKTQKRRKPGNLAKMMLGSAAGDDESEYEDSDEDSDGEDDDDFGSAKSKQKGVAASGGKGKKPHAKAAPERPLKGKKAVQLLDPTVKSKGAIDKAKGKGKAKANDEGKEAFLGKGKGKAGKKAGQGGAGAHKGKGGGGDDGDDSDDDDAAGGSGDPDALGMRARRAKEKAEKAARVAAKSTLHRVFWHRVILDEAHAIKDRRCSTAQAVFGLHAHVRWCLSGTPLQNRVGELYSLVQFLRLDPYSFYFCKVAGCDCKCREYKFDAEYRACDYCGHSPLQHYSLFNRDIVNPIKKHGYLGAGRTGFVKLKRSVLDKCLLRRTKAGRASEMVLPPKLVTLEANFLDDREFDFYQAIYTQSQAQFGSYVQAGTLLNNYAHIFDLLTRLRQAVDHPYLVVHSNRGVEAAAEAALTSGLDAAEVNAATNGSAVICGLCFDDAALPVESGCGHFFCRACVVEYIDAHVEGAALQCPTCTQPLSVELSAAAPSPPAGEAARGTGRRGSTGAEMHADGSNGGAPAVRPKGILGKLNLAQFQSSTKIEALMEELHLMQENDPAAKAIVFSQFVSFLDLMEFRLQKAGIKVVKLNGGMTVAARDGVLSSFKVAERAANAPPPLS
jgi:DNA repair protein RAD16